jgi:ATP-dependent protease ClpP protease subunit
MAKYDHIDFSPPQGVQDEAAKGLEWRREHGRGGTEVGVARARDLSNGKNISPQTARRMASYFARHEVDKQGTGWSPGDDGFPSAGRIAWALWGGDPGQAWASKLTTQMDSVNGKSKPKAQTMQTLRIDGAIGQGEGETSAERVAEFLERAGGQPVTFVLHSEGGSVYEGMAIHDRIAAYDGDTKCVIQSMAFSIASFVALAADEVEITPNGWMMIHNPYVMAEGSDSELNRIADQIKALRQKMIDGYAKRMGAESATVQAMMDSETYLDAEQAVAMGLADRVTPEPVRSGRQIMGSARLPHDVVLALLGPQQREESEMTIEKKPATARAIKQALPKAKADFIVRCMEKEMSMEEVKDEYMESAAADMTKLEEMLEEMTSAKAVLEQELEEAKAKISAMEKEHEEEAIKAKARYRTGGPALPVPVASAQQGSDNPREEWEQVIASYVGKGMNRMNAVKAANRSHGHVRAALLQVVNS